MNQPGCYGISICANSSALCKRCKFSAGCIAESTRELELIHRNVDARFFLKRVAGQIVPKRQETKATPKATAENLIVDNYQTSIVESMPKKPGEVARQLFKRGVDLHKELSNKRNPYHVMRPEFMRVACDLAMHDGFNREELRVAMLGSNIGISSIESYCSIACSVLTSLDVVSIVDSRYKLKENT